EAQDILIDVMGAVTGLQELSAPVWANLTNPVRYGGGSISFSHGTMKVPAPATEVMIRNNNIPVEKGPIETELFTPTGAALLSALQAKEIKEKPVSTPQAEGCSRGTKELPIEPLKIFLFKK
ncbi:MAG: nickel insertion protein, partial [Marinilabiliaceae bacterium]